MVPRSVAHAVGVLLVALLALAGSAAPALADDKGDDVGSCLSTGQVWLLVVTETEEVLANQCVGVPASGEAALAEGGVAATYADGGLICTLGGHPETCPATFDGSYWSYYNGEPGKEYAFYEVGAGASKPQPGNIEAWCYATAATKMCTPPQLVINQAGQQVAPPAGTEAVDLPVTHNQPVGAQAETPWAWIATGAVVVLVIVGLLVWLGITRRGRGTTGGR